MNWLEFAKLVAAAIGGGAVVPYLTNQKDRRTARAAVADMIAEIEGLRWADNDDPSALINALNRFEARAMIARTPRRAVTLYRRLYILGRATHRRTVEQHSNPELGIDDKLDKALKDSRDIIIGLCWNPWLRRWRLNTRVTAIANDVEGLRSNREIAWYSWDFHH